MQGALWTARARWRHVPKRYNDDDVVEPLVVPDALNTRLPELYHLEDAGVALQRAVVAFELVRVGVYTQYTYWRYGGVIVDHETGDEDEMEEPEDVGLIFDRADAALGIALRELESLAD